MNEAMEEKEEVTEEEATVDVKLEAMRGEDAEKTGVLETVTVFRLEMCSTDNSSEDESDREEEENENNQIDWKKLN